MRYLLTLEKFKSNILTKVFKLVSNNHLFKNFLSNLLEEHGIKISDLKDEHFKYVPTNKISKYVEYEIEDYKFYDDNGEYIKGSLKEGDFLIENDGYVHEITNIDDSGVGTNIHPLLFEFEFLKVFLKNSSKNFIKIPKEHSTHLIQSHEGSRTESTKHAFKMSKNQVWEYGDNKERGRLGNIDGYENDYGSADLFVNGNINQNIVNDLNLKALIRYQREVLEYEENDILLGFNYENELKFYFHQNYVSATSDDLKKESDYVIILNMKKVKSDLQKLDKQRDERKKGKEGSPHFMKDSDILKMNRKRLISKLNDRYKLSEKDVENLKKYTDFKKIFSKIVSKNPVLVLEDNKIWDDINMILKSFKHLLKYNEDERGKNIENIKGEISSMNSYIKNILTHPLVMSKVDLFNELREHSDFTKKEILSIDNMESNLNKLGDKIQSYINNFEYENLNDIHIIFNKVKSYREVSEDLKFILNPSVIGFKALTFSIIIKKEIVQSKKEILMDNLKYLNKASEDIKTLIKIW